jgi:hypothetical protein
LKDLLHKLQFRKMMLNFNLKSIKKKLIFFAKIFKNLQVANSVNMKFLIQTMQLKLSKIFSCKTNG